MASRAPKPGRAKLAPMLSETGRLKGDLTVINWGDGTFWIEGSYYLRGWHMRWFADHSRDGVHVRDISDDVIGFSISGPRSRELLERVTHQDVSNAAMPVHGRRDPRYRSDPRQSRASLGHRRAGLRDQLPRGRGRSLAQDAALAAAPISGVKEYGYNALLALRLEKSFGIWSAEFTQAYTPRMTGMDRWIAWDKGDFVGRKAALAEREGPAAMAPAGHARSRRGRRGLLRL